MDLLKLLNPVSALIDLTVNTLGIPDSVGNIAKVAAGAVTGNAPMLVDGTASLTSSLLGTGPETEYTSLGVPSGYATTSVDSQKMKQAKAHLETIRDNLSKIEDMCPFFLPKDGLISMTDIQIAINHPDCPPKLRESLLYLKNHQDFYGFVDTAAGIGGKDGIIGIADLHDAIYQLGEATSATPSNPSSSSKPQIPSQCSPSAGPPHKMAEDKPLSGRVSALDPNFDRYVEALRTLQANFATYDSAAGLMDDQFTRENLRSILFNPLTSDVLRKAAQFLLDHSEYYNRLALSSRLGNRDGLVGRLDVDMALREAEDAQAQFGKVPQSASQTPSQTARILNDSQLTLEDKLQWILQKMSAGIDDELEQVFQELQETEGEGRGSNDRAQAERKQSSMQKLQLKIQQLMERKKQLFDLMTNLSTKFNEMARAAISNMGRA